MTLYLLTFAIALTQLIDWYTTLKILGASGYELNPVARKGQDLLGINGYLGVKAIAVTGLGYFAGTQSIYLAVAIFAVYAWANVHNWRQMKK